MRVHKSRQQRVVPTYHAVARLKALVHVRNGPQSHDFAGRDGNCVIRKNGVDRCNREHPAGFNQEIYGFGRHLRESAGK
jgi:hypothetical protein